MKFITNLLTIVLVTFTISCFGQNHECGYERCGVNSELSKKIENLSQFNNKESAANKPVMACKRVKVYYIKPADYPYDEDRIKYCDIAIREIQQQWASQGKTAYFEKMEYVATNYTIADIESDYFVFCINNILIPQFGAANGNYKVMFWVDGVFSPCCAAGGGDYAGAPGWGVQGNVNHYGFNNPNDAGMPGLIGHELGHAFGINHEDGHPDNGSVPCDQQCIPKGIMCNGASYSPCGEFNGYPQVTITDYHNNYFNNYPDYFNELGGSCDAPNFIWDTDYPNLQFETAYVIRNQGSNKVLSIGADNSLVQQDYTGSPNQRWTITPEQYGLNTPNYIRYSQLINVGTGQAADNYAFNTDSGGDIVAWASNGKTNQQWRLVNRNGVYAIQNMASGRVMDVAGASTAENANIQQWQWNGTGAQLWNFEQIIPCTDLGGDSDGDGICDNEDTCPNLNDNLIGTACNDSNPGTSNDIWQSNCSCQGTPNCTVGAACDGEYGPNTGTYDSNCNCITAPCSNSDLYAGNCDLDGDGILNGDDQDDDNDGILDIEECPVSNVVTNSSFDGLVGIEQIPTGWQTYTDNFKASTNDINNGAWGGSFPTNVTVTNSSDGGTWLGLSSLGTVSMGIQQQVTLEAGTTYSITFEQSNFGADLSSIGANSTGAPGQIEVLIDAGTSQPLNVIGTGSNMPLGTDWNNVNVSFTAQTSGVHTLALVCKQTGNQISDYNNIGIDDLRISVPGASGCDIDNDGISNQYDTDSDNDGCADALEGTASLTNNSIFNNGQLKGSVDPNTGIPTIVGAGQSLGNSQDASTQDQDCSSVVVSSKIQAKVFLEGFFNGSNSLAKNADHATLIPNSQPFNTAPWNYNGNESTNAIPANAVDWILLVARDVNGNIQEQKAGFISTSGEIMDTDGTMGISLNNASTYFSIHHKSHLAVMSSSAYTSGIYDFTNNVNQAMGTAQMAQQGGKYMMYSGDYDCNGIINNVDYNNWKTNGATLNQYLKVDGDGNGIINNLDYNLWTRNRSKIGHPPLQY